MKRIVAIMLVLTFICSFYGCGSHNSNECKHNWERVENYSEYTAMDKCSKCNMTRKYTDPDRIPHSGTEAGFKMVQYHWSGYGLIKKEIYDCDLGYAIIDCLSELQETGEVIPKISDDVLVDRPIDLAVPRGTMWIECGSVGMFRLDPEWTEICKVQTHYGEGRVLQMTDTLRSLLGDAWYYYPNDYWLGTYENGKVTLEQVYKEASAVESVSVDSIHIENKIESHNNKIALSVLANENKTVMVSFISRQSDDNLGTLDSKEIVLTKDEETTVDFEFFGFYNVMYEVTITIDNTRVTLYIEPGSTN